MQKQVKSLEEFNNSYIINSMKKTILFLLLLIISISSISQEIPVDKKQYLLEKSYEILEFIYQDSNDFVREPDKVFTKEENGENLIIIRYEERKFLFKYFRGVLKFFDGIDKKDLGRERKQEYLIQKTRKFIRKSRPDLNDIFIFPKAASFNNGIFRIVYFYYFKGFPSLDWIIIEIKKDGNVSYFHSRERFNYKVPDKIISYEEAQEKVNDFFEENYKKGFDFWGEKIESFNIVEFNHEQKEKYSRYGLEKLNQRKPIFMHPNTSFGKYGFKLKKDENGTYYKDIETNLKKYGFSKEDFNYNGWNWANFVRLSYIIWVDKPIVHFDSNYSGLIVDAETGEIIGGM